MKIISHRGNLTGKLVEKENHPDYIDVALSSGYEVEIDIWYEQGQFYLGHDYPQYVIDLSWLSNRKDKLWIHAKNLTVTEKLHGSDFNWFWHDIDKITITSKGTVWCSPNIFVKNGITVLFDIHEVPDYILGVCTDEPFKFKNEICL